MLEKLFGNPVIEKILFYLLLNEQGYGVQLSATLNVSLSSAQNALERLEAGGIVVSQMQGKTRVYQFNPRYPLLKELRTFLNKAYTFLPEKQKHQFYETPIRRRPRRKGKPLNG